MKMAQVLTPQELNAMSAGAEKPTFVDVRRRADYEAAPKTIMFDPDT